MAVGPEASAGTLEVALAHGLVIAVMVSAVGHISGGHFNPAITFGFLLTRRISVLLGLAYWFAQLLGGVLAALLLRWIFPATTRDAAQLGAPARHTIDLGPALVVEALLTFFLVWVVFATTADPRGTYTAIAGLAIGLVVVFDNLLGYPLTGVRWSIRPVRSARSSSRTPGAISGSGTSARWPEARSRPCSTTSSTCVHSARPRWGHPQRASTSPARASPPALPSSSALLPAGSHPARP